MTDAGDADVDAAWRAALRASAPGSAHPDEATWLQLFEGTLEPARRETILDHVSACVTCAGIFKAARTAALEQIPSAVPAPPRVIRLLPQLAAATAVLAIAVVVIRQQMAPPAAVVPAAPIVTSPATPATSATPAPAATPITIEKPPVVISMEQLLVTRARGDQGAYAEELARALEPYKQDDFPEAARRLASVAKKRPDAFEPAYYLGASLLLSGKAQDAVPPLERAVTLASAARREDAARLLASAREAAARR